MSQPAPPLPVVPRREYAPPSEPPWGEWSLFQGYESQMPIEQPQNRGEYCPELAVLASNFSRDVFFRNNIVFAEGDGTAGIPPELISIDVEVRPNSTVGWDSEF